MLEKESIEKKRSAFTFIPTIASEISKIFKKYIVDVVSFKNNNLKSLLGSRK